MQNPMRFKKTITISIYTLAVLYLMVVYFSSLNGIHDFTGNDVLGRDFINFWSGGYATLSGQVVELYNKIEYRQFLLSNFDPPLNNYAFSYPPHSLLIFSPFGALPYVYGLILWTFGGITLAYVASKKWFKKADYSFWVVLGPAAMISLFGGQTGLWVCGIWMFAFYLLDKRPVVSGILIGLLTVKPQIGVLLVLFLLCRGYWKVIISASVTTVLIVLISILLFGVEPWQLFIQDTLPLQAKIITVDYGVFDFMVHTPFKWVINLNGPSQLAWAVQAIFMILGGVVIIWACRKSTDDRLLIALLSVLTFLFSPYMVIYDMTILAFAALLYLQYCQEKPNFGWRTNPLLMWIIIGLVMTPVLGFYASQMHVPLSVILMSLFSIIIILDISKSSTQMKPYLQPSI